MMPSASPSQTISSEHLEQRRQDALKLADQCIQHLKQEFGATQAILFGSLRGDTPWHDQSDLDLAVQGLSESDIWEAYDQLEKLMPPWLQLDLLAIEQAPERLRDRMLQTLPMPDNPYLAPIVFQQIQQAIALFNQWLDQSAGQNTCFRGLP